MGNPMRPPGQPETFYPLVSQRRGVGDAPRVRLKLSAACGGESSICKEKEIGIHSLSPGLSPGNSLADRLNEKDSAFQ
jgi:hypothetical protein